MTEARHVVGKLQIMTTLKCRICAKSTYSTIQPVVNLFYYSTILLIFETLHKYKLLLSVKGLLKQPAIARQGGGEYTK